MVDIEVLGILRIICEILISQEGGRKFDSQTTQLTDNIKCKAHKAKDHRVSKGKGKCCTLI